MPLSVGRMGSRLLRLGFPRLFGGMKGLSKLFGGGGVKGWSGLFGGIGDFLPKIMNMWGKVRSVWSMMSPLRTMMKSLLAG
ncbi:hypothetical protein [Kroppenstedtia eburnea]|uniref:Uncharacterized protein n=1 Tax=Kroppenstedtia eburnea TaxID=714067 RepID=A0A1N7JUR8_9BACL|nr:hypothetical protein [Kroppenstedtia eburnea]QKI83426.1 hypothetical protein GXN75_16385 [Kroppenstedtia eburnea]SIS53089.1 hypothetical protein SAMN05421790_102309 [Kroppenstedtia eburnea]